MRERFAEEAPLVAIVLDRRPSMGIYERPSPWLDKPRRSRRRCARSSRAPTTRAPRSSFDGRRTARRWQPRERTGADRAQRGRACRLRCAGRRARQCGRHALTPACEPAGRQLRVPDLRLPRLARARVAVAAAEPRADIVPVIVQDPTWERSFPDVSGVLLPTVAVATGEPRPVRLSRRETRARSAQHEQRYLELATRFRRAGMDPVTLAEAEPEAIHRAFLAWAERRRRCCAGHDDGAGRVRPGSPRRARRARRRDQRERRGRADLHGHCAACRAFRRRDSRDRHRARRGRRHGAGRVLAVPGAGVALHELAPAAS